MNRLTPAAAALLCACDPSKIDFPDGDCEETVWYADADADGYGDVESHVTSCEAPAGWIEDAGDCDDADDAVHPDAEERCNALDDDCDREVDEGAGGETWYTDVDGDGYGDSSDPQESCELPEDAVTLGGDCDDADASVTICRYEGDTPLREELDATLVGEQIMDMAGYRVHHAGDLNGDGFGDIVSTTNQSYGSTGGAYVVLGPLSGERNLSTADAIVRAGDEAPELPMLMRGLDARADLTGDGEPDLSFGDYMHDVDDLRYAGRIWVLETPLEGELDLSAASAVISGTVADGCLGAEMTRMDVDGDGAQDMVAQVVINNGGGEWTGEVHVFRGPLSGAVDTPDLSIYSESSLDGAGSALLDEDIDGDGVEDLLIGARNAGGGVIYAFQGPLGLGAISLDDADVAISGHADSGHLGEELGQAGDMDGDGYADLIATAPYATDGLDGAEGATWLFSGPLTGALSVDDARATLRATEASSPFIYMRSTHADLDLDGSDDLVLGLGVANSFQGAAYTLYGPVSGAVDLDTDEVPRLLGDPILASFILDVDAQGDVNADGVPDLLVGAAASLGETSADTQAGRAHLLYGGIP